MKVEENYVIKYKDYKDGILEGKIITRYLHAVDTTIYNFADKNYRCWTRRQNTNYIEELGHSLNVNTYLMRI